MTGNNRLNTSDRVVIRSREEILATLDADGTIDGLPFMPEMLAVCGQTLRVERRVEKTCVDVSGDEYPMRRFAANDVVVLEGQRCDGSAHDGCDRGCKLFWKEAWLKPASAADIAPPHSAQPANPAALKVKSDERHYFCQSTELYRATEPFPGKKKPWMVRVALREIRNGDRSATEMLWLFARWIWQRTQRALHGNQWLRGPHKQTPVASLCLTAGDPVRVRSRDEIVATLNHARRNRGMGVCYEMTRFCGAEAEVQGRMERLIDERTGEMRAIHDTVILRNVRANKRPLDDEQCLCFDALGDCPRGELMYWREIWLERMNGSANGNGKGSGNRA